jgi:hypothetical protein
MGLLGRLKDTVVHKLDGPPKPPPHEWPPDQAWARLLRAEHNPGSRSGAYRDEAPSMLDDAIDRTTGVRYGFELEVHRPDRSTYSLMREERVPAKVEGTLFLTSHKIPANAEVPLRVTGPGEEDVELDWNTYLAIPDQAARAYHLRIQNGYANPPPR